MHRFGTPPILKFTHNSSKKVDVGERYQTLCTGVIDYRYRNVNSISQPQSTHSNRAISKYLICQMFVCVSMFPDTWGGVGAAKPSSSSFVYGISTRQFISTVPSPKVWIISTVHYHNCIISNSTIKSLFHPCKMPENLAVLVMYKYAFQRVLAWSDLIIPLVSIA